MFFRSSTVEEIEADAFAGCPSLYQFHVDVQNPWYSSVDGSLFNRAETTLVKYADGRGSSCTVPDGVMEIGDNAFMEGFVVSVRMPDTVEWIGSGAFEGCYSLREIILSDSLIHIGADAFRSCQVLSSIDLPDSVLYIGSGGFLASGLTSITIPHGVKVIEPQTFLDCQFLQSVFLSNTVGAIYDMAFSNCGSLTDIMLPGSVQYLHEGAFSGAGLQSITMTGNLRNVGENAFNYCDSLMHVYYAGTADEWDAASASAAASGGNDPLLSAQIHFIGSCGEGVFWSLEANGIRTTLTIRGRGPMYDYSSEDSPFRSCPDVDYIVIESGVTSIGNYAFYGCGSLGGINMPDTLERIGSYAFYNCAGLGASANAPDPMGGHWVGGPRLSIHIPESVVSIGGYAFYGCSGLERIILPAVTAVEEYTFYGCSGLYYAFIPESVASIGTCAFAHCAFTGVELPGTTVIGTSAFEDCTALRSVTLSAGLVFVSNYAFDGCGSLETVFYAGTGSQWSDVMISGGNQPLANADVYYVYSADSPAFGRITKSFATVQTTHNSTTSPMMYLGDGTIVKILGESEGFYKVQVPDSGSTGQEGYITAGSVRLLSYDTISASMLMLPSGLLSLESEAFAQAAGFLAVRVPANTEYIEDDAFRGRDIIIFCAAGSYAQNWATEHGYWYVNRNE